MTKFTVIGGGDSQDLARRISRKLGATYVGSKTRVFPDGEGKISLNSKPKGDTIIIVQSTMPPVDSNLIRVISLIHKAREFSDRIIAVVPYMGYARQDREFLSGEIVTMDVVASMFQKAGAKKIIMVDIHSAAGLEKFEIPASNVSAMPELAKYFKKMRLKNPLVVSPDLGGTDRAKKFAKLLGSEYISLKKQRDLRTGKVKITNQKLQDISGRDLVLVDDMISTGGSIVKAGEFLKSQGCKKIFVACTHALLIDGAEKKIKKAGIAQIISTNTVPGSTSIVDVSGIIAEAVN